MSFDPITESIVHFIGSFNMIEEAARARAEYDRFRAEKAAQKESELLDLNSARIKAPHKLEGFDPGVGYKAPSVADLKAAPDFAAFAQQDSVAPQNGPLLPLAAIGHTFEAVAPAAFGINFTLAPASSVIAVIVQLNALADNDTFGTSFGGNLAENIEFTALLETLADWAADLGPVRLDLVASGDSWYLAVQTMMEAAPDTGVTSQGPLTVAVFAGGDATGYVVNGASAADLPVFEDFIPPFLIDDDTLEDETADTDQDTGTDGEATQSAAVSASISAAQPISEEDPQTADAFANAFDDSDPLWPEQDDGHHVVAGANTMVNETSIFSNWLDAPVFVVVGDVLNVDAISQTNILIDYDSAPLPLIGEGNGSTAVNAAGIVTKEDLSEETDESQNDDLVADVPEGGIADVNIDAAAQDIIEDADDENATSEEATPIPTGVPDNWVVTQVTGNVTQINWVEQTSFITDNDRAEITATGSKTTIGLGENEAVNSVDLWEIGFSYDLVVVSGDFIDANVIAQLNVLIDSDVVTSTTAPIEETVESIAEHATSEAALVPDDLDLGGAAAPHQEVVLQDAPDTSVAAEPIAEVSAEPSPTPALQAAEADPLPTSDTPEGGSISTSDNLLFNSAEIVTQGEDTSTQLAGDYQELAEDFLNDDLTVDDDILDNDVFDGAELLRVLYIDGDFETINLVTQTNVLGDSDLVHLAADEFAAGLNEQIQVTTGSNIQANFASIVDAGQPSEIHAGGESYSDALIHQAELVDTDAVPNGVDIAALTSEAVAFLVDGMIEPNLADDIIAQANDTIAAATSGSDVMQQMLG